jgi:phospholipid-binding lipoprotein MlaA
VLHSPVLRKAALQPRGAFARIHVAAIWTAALLGLALLGGCATPPSADDPEALAAYKEANDPLEPMNRYFFELNFAADELLFKPLAGWYYVGLPNFAQDGVRNVIRNVHSPVVLANDLFQGETDRAGVTVSRFLVNSTMGLGGLFDIASRMGLDYHDEDFGQTLAVHGVGEGPYLMLPLLGPSNPRDAVGMAVDMLFDPLTYVGIFGGVDNIGLGAALAEGVDTRARNLKTLDAIRKGSLDYYATIRSLYRQHRNDEINNGKSASGGSPGIGTGGDQSFLSSPPPPQVSAAEPQPSAGPLVPRQQPLAKALPLFIIKEPAGAIPVTTEP